MHQRNAKSGGPLAKLHFHILTVNELRLFMSSDRKCVPGNDLRGQRILKKHGSITHTVMDGVSILILNETKVCF